MKKINTFFFVLLVINIILIVLALMGAFEGKDLLPIIFSAAFVLLSIVLLILFRKQKSKFKIIGFLLVIVSSVALVHTHFNIFLDNRRENSRNESIDALRNKKAPEITYTNALNINNTIDTQNLFSKNKFTVLNFWATWCKPCIKEMPILEEFYQKNKDKGIDVIGFTDYGVNDKNALTKIENLVKKLNISYPILIDNNKNFRFKYKANVLPATALIGQDGTLIDYQIGINGLDKIMNHIKENLE